MIGNLFGRHCSSLPEGLGAPAPRLPTSPASCSSAFRDRVALTVQRRQHLLTLTKDNIIGDRASPSPWQRFGRLVERSSSSSQNSMVECQRPMNSKLFLYAHVRYDHTSLLDIATADVLCTLLSVFFKRKTSIKFSSEHSFGLRSSGIECNI